MLKIKVPQMEYFDEKTEEFVSVKEQVLKLEHSLLSLSKWESKWHKPFLSQNQKTEEETLDYIRCMTINSDVDPLVYSALTRDNIEEVNKYLEDPMTATWFNDKDNKKGGREVITSEIIYYWMVSIGIPFECEKWHLNRLLTLIRVYNTKSGPQKKMGKHDILKNNAALNAARRGRLGTRG